MRTKIIGWVTAAVLLAAAISLLRGMLGGPDPPPAVDVGVEEALAKGDVARARLSLGYQVRPALIPTSGNFSSDPIAWEAPAALWTAVGFEEASRYQRAPLVFRVSAKGPGGEAVLAEVDASEDLAAGIWHPIRAELPVELGSPVRLHFSIERDAAVGSAGAGSRAVWAAPRLLRAGGDPPPNVLLIVLDTLRADRTSAYGYARPTTPFLEELASRGATVAEMISPYPTTLPSHWTMFSGLNTLRHGTYRPGLEDWPSEMVPLAERLQRAGYLTAAFTEGGYVHAGFGLSQGFDIYDNGPFAREIDARDSADVTFATAAGWIEANRDASFFVFLQT